jgi:hypothetical protein
MATYIATAAAIQDDGWLSPDGKFYNCGCYEHANCAEYLVGVLYPGTSSYGSKVHHLELNGWCHISASRITNYRTELTLTQAQQNTLFDMMMVDPSSDLGSNIASWIGCEDDSKNEDFYAD